MRPVPALVLLALLPQPAAAAWPTDPTVNVPVSVATGAQGYPQAAPDGSGGIIVAWDDQRGGTHDIYVRRVDGTGAPRWTAEGVAICTAAGDQYETGDRLRRQRRGDHGVERPARRRRLRHLCAASRFHGGAEVDGQRSRTLYGNRLPVEPEDHRGRLRRRHRDLGRRAHGQRKDLCAACERQRGAAVDGQRGDPDERGLRPGAPGPRPRRCGRRDRRVGGLP
jgi:hypothetical protein